MLPPVGQPDKFEKLRTQAEALIRKQPQASTKASAEMLDLIHELKIHQAELEIQNEALQNAQQEIATLHREYEDLYEFAPCGYLTLNTKGIIKRANLTAVRFMGVDRNILQQSGFGRYLEDAWKNAFFKARRASGATGEKQRIELPLKTDREKPLWVSVDIEADRDERGEVQQWRMVMVDITGRRQAVEALQQLNETLEKRVAERTELAESRAAQLQGLTVELIEAEERERKRVAYLLHDDLQQGLASAKLQLEEAGHNVSYESAVAKAIEMLQNSIATSRSLSNELSPPVLTHSNLVEALRWLIRRMEEKFGMKVELAAEGIDPVEEPLKRFLFRAVQEFLFNIIKHAGVKTAGISLSQTESHITMTITDQGCGFNREILNDASKPSGFGLITLRERARYIGGTFEIATTPGRGSRFTLKLPAHLSKVESPQQQGRPSGNRPLRPEKPPDIASQTRKSILLVDDHQVMRQGLIDLISNQPDIQAVGEAANGLEAIEKARQLRPDVIVMDISMPEMDGIEATRRIKAEMPEIRVVGLTMHVDEHIERALREAGADAFVNKSGSLDELLRAIREISDPQLK